MSGDTDARESQGFVNQAEKVDQRYGNETDIKTNGGDVAKGNLDKRNQNVTIFQCFFGKDSNFGNHAQELIKDLDFSSIDAESIQEARQKSQSPDAEIWDFRGNNLDEILKELNEFRRLPKFFKLLSLNESIPLEIRHQLKNIVEELKQENPSEEQTTQISNNFPSNPDKTLESYLIITLNHSDEDSEKFLLNAWLIDDDSIKDLSKYKFLLDLDEHQHGVLCKFSEISKQLDKFLSKSLDILGGRQHKLIIEFFLPSDLICTEVDRWKISIPIIGKIPLGSRYPVRIRSLERLEPNYIKYFGNQWIKNWKKFRDVVNNKPTKELFEHLKEMDNFDGDSLEFNLEEKIGLKLTCAPPQPKIKDLFNAILAAAIPMAIWTRCDLPHLDQAGEIDKILDLGPLCHLCEQVRKIRKKAKTKEHLGFHLAVLWEDPYRLPPRRELISPGK